MPISDSTRIYLHPRFPNLPSRLLLNAWEAARFEPRACRRSLEAWIRRFNIPDSWFCAAEIDAGGLAATRELLLDALYRPQGDWVWRMSVHSERRAFAADVPTESVPEVADLIRTLAHTDNYRDFVNSYSGMLENEIREVISLAFTEESAFGTWPEIGTPGIYRREHANVIFSSGETLVAFDPQSSSGAWTTADGRCPRDRSCKMDAVIITHSHADHWHLGSVLKHCDERTRVIVPQVPRVNLLTREDFSQSLKIAGQSHEVLPWGGRCMVGDVEIQALPFLGEQPTRKGPPALDGVRNWGNCYRVTSPRFSALILADSGGDPMGEMRDVIARSRAKDGPIDILLSCCESFPEGINAGLPDYLLTLPFDTLRRIFSERQRGRWDSITSGRAGVADLCALAGARFFLPYAHGFEGLGMEAGSAGVRGQGETRLLNDLQNMLVQSGVATEVVPWNPGDQFTVPH